MQSFSRRFLAATLGLAGLVAAGAAQARDVQWAVTIGGPVGVSVWGGAPRVHLPLPPPVVVAPVPVYGRPSYGHHDGYRHPPRHHAGHGYGHGYGDRDRDGIPNRYDRRYNPRWDRDGDGIPNRYDRRHTPHWDRDGDGVPNRHDRRHGRGHGRDDD